MFPCSLGYLNYYVSFFAGLLVQTFISLLFIFFILCLLFIIYVLLCFFGGSFASFLLISLALDGSSFIWFYLCSFYPNYALHFSLLDFQFSIQSFVVPSPPPNNVLFNYSYIALLTAKSFVRYIFTSLFVLLLSILCFFKHASRSLFIGCTLHQILLFAFRDLYTNIKWGHISAHQTIFNVLFATWCFFWCLQFRCCDTPPMFEQPEIQLLFSQQG